MGMTATFMPKPLYGEAGSGMHFHQQLWQGRHATLFYDPAGYGALSETARFYIAGLLAPRPGGHGLHQPVDQLLPAARAGLRGAGERHLLASATAAPRSASPSTPNRPETARIEFRPPDATCNPYLAIAAQLMAGIDGIRRRLDPTALGFGPVDEDIFSWPAEKRARDQGAADLARRGARRPRARPRVPAGGRRLQPRT